MTSNTVNWGEVPPCISATAVHVESGRIYRVGDVWVDRTGRPVKHVYKNCIAEYQSRLPEAQETTEDDVYVASVRALSFNYAEAIRNAFSASYEPARVSDMSVPGYETLAKVLKRAYEQAAIGKGKERHGGGQRFDEQPMQQISDLLNDDAGMAFQACKKIHESRGLEHEAKIRELLGAINYIAGMVIWHERNHKCAEATTQKS